ncbi:DUF7289 family protein [Halorubrum laminariae]|uniref:Archaellin/type IV pilin N-terminal domain-containing protein n=1 Tax=Halorubrum laminariae TaxID=1433523 RepID=A0ABD6C5A8_9EURY|nr:archaellin/type IV pilin N-terminal domain-containing protein [Halorubrum laminariae]
MTIGERGQSEVIGVVLLLGITIAAVTATVATGSVALGLVTDEAQSAGVENGMSQLSSQSSLVALGEADARRFDLGSVDGGQLRLDENAGRVEVRIEDGTDGDTTVYNDSIGTLEYVGEDRTVALQGGGVWTASNGYGRMISPPEYHYRGTTLTFPVVRLNGSEEYPQRGTGVVRQPPNASSGVTETANPLEDGTVVVEVQSDYYEGWYDFFSQRADGSVTKYDENRTTVARLVTPLQLRDRPLSIGTGGVTNPSGKLDESKYSTGNTHPSPEPLIREQIADGEANGTDISECFDSDGSCTSGLYYTDSGYEVSDSVDFNTTEGDIRIVVDGDFDIESETLEIEDDTDNDVRYYINGSMNVDKPTIGTAAESVDADRTQFYVNGDGISEDNKGMGNAEIDAIIYAPNANLDITGNPTLRGVFVFYEANINGNVDIQYDSSVADLELSEVLQDDQNVITYLHVTENVVEVDFD